MVRLKIQKVLISLVSFIIIIYMILDKEDKTQGALKEPPRYLKEYVQRLSKVLPQTMLIYYKSSSTQPRQSNRITHP